MNRAQLERLGEAGLRQIALRLGLRGARHYDRSLLIIGLTAYFDHHPGTDEPTDEDSDDWDGELGGAPGAEGAPSPGPDAARIPPALATETMARLLESQGQVTQASALRARLGHQTPPPAPPARDPAPEAAPVVSIHKVDPQHLELVWEGAPGTEPGLVVRLWDPDGELSHWELPLTTPRGRMRFDPPPRTVRLCAALGRMSGEGFEPAARSAVVQLRPASPTGKQP